MEDLSADFQAGVTPKNYPALVTNGLRDPLGALISSVLNSFQFWTAIDFAARMTIDTRNYNQEPAQSHSQL